MFEEAILPIPLVPPEFELPGSLSNESDGDPQNTEVIVVVGVKGDSGGGGAPTLHISNIVVGNFMFNGTDYQGHYLHDLLEMTKTGHAPGTPENPVDEGEFVVLAGPESSSTLTTSQMYGFASQALTSLANGGLVISTGGAYMLMPTVMTPVPGDEAAALTAVFAGNLLSLVAGTAAAWAKEQEEYHLGLEKMPQFPGY